LRKRFAGSHAFKHLSNAKRAPPIATQILKQNQRPFDRQPGLQKTGEFANNREEVPSSKLGQPDEIRQPSGPPTLFLEDKWGLPSGQ
jgi:hypothetical protein